ncbi:NHL repeat-containing protein [Salinarimonas chemoclinalis]|uniref:NHL repeat-containing protein n=1 Tax=Salinarimonas chemoclinalis TaxID=3241599 RepID=UPI0035573B2A
MSEEPGVPGWIAYGPRGEIELGLRYREAPRIPEHPIEHIEGCCAPAPGLLAISQPERGLVRLLDAATGRELRAWHLPGVAKLWSDGTGEILAARPVPADIVRLSAADGASLLIRCPGLAPVHAARWGDEVLVVDRGGAGLHLVAPTGEHRPIPVAQRLLAPSAAVPMCDDTFLLCDRDAHLAARIARDGRVVWRFGVFEDPSSDTDRLANPEHVCRIGGRHFAIADMRNSRIVCLDVDGACVAILGSTENIGSTDGALWAPVATAPGPQGLVVADSGNGRLVERRLGRADREIWGEARVASSLLHHPRSATPIGRDLLVADCYHDRVVRLARAGRLVSTLGTACGRRMFWPRSTAYVNGASFVSDGRNRRLLRFDADGRAGELRLDAGGVPWPLSDPHAVRAAAGNLLVTDTDHASVYLVTPSGRILFAWGPNPPPGVPGLAVDLSDVHDAFADPHGGVWIADTGHDRLVLVDARTVLEPVAPRSAVLRVLADCGLRAPRSVEVTQDGLLLVCDSDNHRIVLLDAHGEMRFSHGGRYGHALGHLAHPRMASIRDGRLLVADCINNRILDLPLDALRAPGGGATYTSLSR